MSEKLPALHQEFLPEQQSSLERRIAFLLGEGAPTILLTIISTQGHVARKTGTRAIYTSPTLEGTLGGGLFEKRVVEQAETCLRTRQNCIFSYQGSDDAGRGNREVLCEYLSPDLALLFDYAASLLEAEIRAAWMIDITQPSTPLRSLIIGEEPENKPDGWQELRLAGRILNDTRLLARIMRTSRGRPCIQKDRKYKHYLEPFAIPAILLICGAGHVAKATAKLARQCGFTVDIADDRGGILPAEFPMARSVMHTPDFENIVSTFSISQQHFVIIMTHSHELDQKCLTQILASHAAYIGMLGSVAKRDAIFEHLKTLGIPATELAAVHCPIGLAIGAETPEQIAVSIVAELLAVQSGMFKHLQPRT